MMAQRLKSILVLGLLLACCGGATAQYGPGGPGSHGPRTPHTYRSHRHYRAPRSVYRTTAPTYRSPRYRAFDHGNDFYGPRFINITEFGYAFGTEGSSRLALYESGLLMFSPAFGLGLGVGANYSLADDFFVPLYGMGRIVLSNSIVGLFVDCKVGYSVGNLSGFYLSPSVGMRFGYDSPLTFSLGYELQRYSIINSYGLEYSDALHGMTLRIGVEL